MLYANIKRRPQNPCIQSIQWGPKFGPWSEFGPLFNIGTILVPFWCVWSDFLCLYMGIREKEGKKEETGTLLNSSASQSFHRSKIHFQTFLKPLNFRTCNHCEYESTAKNYFKPLNFWTCNHCEYESSAKTTLNWHFQLVFEKRKYECDNCEC